MNTPAELLSSRVKAEILRLLFGTGDAELHVRRSNGGPAWPMLPFVRAQAPHPAGSGQAAARYEPDFLSRQFRASALSRYSWTAALSDAKIGDFRFHDLRHRQPGLPTRVPMPSRSPRSLATVQSKCRRVTPTPPTKENAVLLRECRGAKIPVTYRSHN